MVHFNGDNYYNNRIIVDYVKRRVFFIPVAIKHFLNYYFSFFINCLIFLFMWTLIPFGVFITLLAGVGHITAQYSNVLFNFSLVVIGLGTFLMTLPFLIKDWRQKWYPIFMYRIFFKPKKKTITPEQMQFKDKVFIPHFNNVGLFYNLYGDFKDIKKVTIVELFEEDQYNWSCLFLFNKNIKEGRMEIEYV